jgi:lysophospholipase L1-like esterase
MKRKNMILMWLTLFTALLFACHKQNNPMPLTVPSTPVQTVQKEISYLALGDSYTIGHNLTEEERFPYFVAQLLNKNGFTVTNLKYIAETGWSTFALQSAIADAEPLSSFDIVTLLIGVNDQYQGLDIAGYRIRFTELLNKAVSIAKGNASHVFVLSIPDYSATPFVSEANKEKVRQGIDAFNAINKEVTLQRNISYTDITALSREAKNNPSLLAEDGLHYSADEHYRWAERLLESILPALK